MDIQIVTVFYPCDKILESLNHQQDPQTQMSDAQVMTTAIVAALCFGGNFTTASEFLKIHRYIPNMLSKSRFNRRLHRIKPMFITPLKILGKCFIELNENKLCAINTI